MRALIFGRSGQLARACLAEAPGALALGRAELDLGARLNEAIEEAIERADASLAGPGPLLVVNAAAYTAVDQAEAAPEHDAVWRLNAEAPAAMAVACRERGLRFVHFSTDYVFSGEGSRPWREEDETGPLSAYGRSKLEGERAALAEGALVVRTSWVFDGSGRNFLTTMLKLGATREELRVVDDQVGAPTFAPHLARGALELASRGASGLYHLCASGETSWCGFARRIFEEAARRGHPMAVKTVKAIGTAEYPTPARRPLNCRLSCEKAEREFGVRLPSWEQGLGAAFDEIS